MRLIYSTLMFTVFGLGMVGLPGCDSNPQTETTATPAVEHDHDEHADHDEAAHAAAGHDDGGWWCVEHGVPEEECPLCDTSLVAAFKDKGDWCDEHNRPESQCFTCNPDNFAKFAARYEAKVGEQPPKPTE